MINISEVPPTPTPPVEALERCLCGGTHRRSTDRLLPCGRFNVFSVEVTDAEIAKCLRARLLSGIRDTPRVRASIRYNIALGKAIGTRA